MPHTVHSIVQYYNTGSSSISTACVDATDKPSAIDRHTVAFAPIHSTVDEGARMQMCVITPSPSSNLSATDGQIGGTDGYPLGREKQGALKYPLTKEDALHVKPIRKLDSTKGITTISKIF